jgi:hypothetical protein
MTDPDELRALIREVIRDLVPLGLPIIETVSLSTDEELAAFVARLLDLGPDQRQDIQSGRKRFRLASATPSPSAALQAPSGAVRRIERGAVTEAMVARAARAGERLVLGRGAVLTPLARDLARASGVEISKER